MFKKLVKNQQKTYLCRVIFLEKTKRINLSFQNQKTNITMSRFSIFIILNLFAILQAKANMTITVIAPNTTPISDVLYIAGDFNTWSPNAANYAATPLGNFRYTISIPPPTNNAMLFKFTRGAWTTVECMTSGADIVNRSMTYQEGGSATFTIANWKDLGGTTHTLSGNCGVLITNL
jgi:hypothetical protein